MAATPFKELFKQRAQQAFSSVTDEDDRQISAHIATAAPVNFSDGRIGFRVPLGQGTARLVVSFRAQ